MERGRIIVITGPPGTGKSTVWMPWKEYSSSSMRAASWSQTYRSLLSWLQGSSEPRLWRYNAYKRKEGKTADSIKKDAIFSQHTFRTMCGVWHRISQQHNIPSSRRRVYWNKKIRGREYLSASDFSFHPSIGWCSTFNFKMSLCGHALVSVFVSFKSDKDGYFEALFTLNLQKLRKQKVLEPLRL